MMVQRSSMQQRRCQKQLVLCLAVLVLALNTVTAAPLRKQEQPPFYAKITIHNTIQDASGRVYDLNVVKPDATIFDPAFYYYDSPHSTEVISYATGKRTPVAVYRGTYKGTTILMGRNENDAITFLQLRPGKNEEATFFYGNTTDHTLIGVRSSDFDYSGAKLEDGDDLEVLEATSYQEVIFPTVPTAPPTRTNRRKRGSNRRRNQQFVYERGDGDADECTVFKVIPIAIAYDAEFCDLHRNDATAAEVAIQIIVAGGSEYYENDMCTKLRLTSILPDLGCGIGGISYYSSFTKTSCGGNPGYLRQFSTFMMNNRVNLNIDPNSLVHMFTGATSPGEIRGCAWRPGLCSLEFGYAIQYQSANHPDPVAQALLFAHELGHNLDAEHAPLTEDELPNYIMEPVENDGSDGFSQPSIDSILALLDSDFITCDLEEIAPTLAPRVTAAPSTAPSKAPSVVPSTVPSKTPSVRPVGTERPTVTGMPSTKPSVSVFPSIAPTNIRSAIPSQSPTTQPPTSRPTAAPTTSKPSGAPTPFPTNPPGCDFVPQSFCVPASGLNNDYACIPKVDLVELASACDNAFFLELTGCFAEIGARTAADSQAPTKDTPASESLEYHSSTNDVERRTALRGETMNTNSRALRKRRMRGKKGKHANGDDDDDGGKAGSKSKSKGGDDDDDDDDDGDTIAPAGPSISLSPIPLTPNAGPTSAPATGGSGPTVFPLTPAPTDGNGNSDRSIRFQAQDCTSNCIAVQEFVCINALRERVISAFYDVSDTSGLQQKLSSLVAVLPEGTNIGTCVLPAATCVETPANDASIISSSGGGVLETP